MLINVPFEYRPSANVKCNNCGHKQKMMPSLNIKKWIYADEYLDGFKVGFEKDYFIHKFEFCENCNNFGNSICFNYTEKFNTEKIQDILSNNHLSQIEKALAIQIEIFPDDLQGYLDLFWYYDFNKNENLFKMYGEMLVNILKIKYQNEQKIEHLALLLEIYRRLGEFENVLEWENKEKEIPYIKTEDRTATHFTETLIIRQIIELSRKRNSKRKKNFHQNLKPRFF